MGFEDEKIDEILLTLLGRCTLYNQTLKASLSPYEMVTKIERVLRKKFADNANFVLQIDSGMNSGVYGPGVFGISSPCELVQLFAERYYDIGNTEYMSWKALLVAIWEQYHSIRYWIVLMGDRQLILSLAISKESQGLSVAAMSRGFNSDEILEMIVKEALEPWLESE